MTTDLEFGPQDGWLIARLNGTHYLAEVPAMYQQIAEACLQAGVKRVLVDISRARIPLSVPDKFTIGEQTTIFSRHGLKVAALVSAAQVLANNFGELVARNRGVNLRVFTRRRPAEDWLLGD
jgi:hypothetical protein